MKEDLDALDAGIDDFAEEVGQEIAESGKTVLNVVLAVSQRVRVLEETVAAGPARPGPGGGGSAPSRSRFSFRGVGGTPTAHTPLGGILPTQGVAGMAMGGGPSPHVATALGGGTQGLGAGVGPLLQSPLPHDMALVNAASTEALTVGELIEEVLGWRRDRTQMEARILKLESDVMAQGGVVFRQNSFSSEQDVRDLVLKEDPTGKALAAFVTPITIYAHDTEFEPKKGWRDVVKVPLKSGKFTEAEGKFICASTIRIPSHYAGNSEVVAGKLLAAFTTEEHWTGKAGIKGQRGNTIASANTAKAAVTTYIRDSLPAGSELNTLATEMATATVTWLGVVHAFFDEDLTELTELGVQVEETLKLLSEYIILMYQGFYIHSQKLIQFSMEVDRVSYLTRIIWVSLLIHQEMDRFTETGEMKHHPTLSAAFIRFLTKATAANNSSSLGKRIAALEKGGPVKAAQDAAKKATSVANKAQDEAARVWEEVLKLKKNK